MADSQHASFEQPAGFRAASALALLFVLALGLLLRTYGLRSGLWLDEMITGWVVADGFSEIGWRSWINNQSPVFFYIVRGSTWLFGFSEAGLRLPSVLAGVAMILLVPAWLRSLGVAPGIAVACAFLVVIDPMLLDPATWARPASLTILSSLLATVAFHRIAIEGSTRPRDHLLFVAAHGAGLYFHYTTIALLVWQLMYAAMLAFRKRDLRFSPRKLAIDTLWIGVLCLPRAPHLADLAIHRGMLEFTRAGGIASELNRYLAVEILVLPLLVSWYFAFSLGHSRWLREDVLRKHLPLLNLLLFLYVLPLLVFWFLSKSDLAQVTTYSRYCAVLPIIGLGLVVDAMERRAPRMICIAAACLLVAISENSPARSFLAEGRFARPYQEWKQAVAQLESDVAERDVVFVDSGLVEQRPLAADSSDELRRYLLMTVSGLYSLAGRNVEMRPISETWAPTDAPTVEAVRSAARIWVLAPAGRPDAARLVSESLASAGVRLGLQEVRRFEGATISILKPER